VKPRGGAPGVPRGREGDQSREAGAAGCATSKSRPQLQHRRVVLQPVRLMALASSQLQRGHGFMRACIACLPWLKVQVMVPAYQTLPGVLPAYEVPVEYHQRQPYPAGPVFRIEISACHRSDLALLFFSLSLPAEC
jgi:hypothetical protein